MKNLIQLGIFLGCMVLALPLHADLFSASDGAFTLDMPTGWVRSSNAPAESVMSLQKAEARIDIKTIDCTSEKCLETSINQDLAEVKSKKMSVIKNTYTDEEIKHFEFSTGEPFYYINFYTPKNDFSAGYFLVNGKGYSILAKNLTYAETDLIFSFISPTSHAKDNSATKQETVNEVNLLPDYDIQNIPEVQMENLEESQSLFTQETTRVQSTLKSTSVNNNWADQLKRMIRKAKHTLLRVKGHTLVSSHMPPYVRELGSIYDAFIILIMVFITLWCIAGIVRLFVHSKHIEIPSQPSSLYPIRIERRYGTPSLIFRAKDSKKNVLTALSPRWDALFMFLGIVILLLTLLFMAAMSLCEQLKWIQFSATSYSTIYSACALLLPTGILVLFCGVVWGQVITSDITLFDRKGQKAALIAQKGYSFFKERYHIYFVHSKESMLAERKRFTLRRHWTLLSKDRVELAHFEERSAIRALLRMLLGHLWGLLRADYDVTGAMESRGILENTHALFNKVVGNVDKPEAIIARDFLAISLLISIRDRDKWYPWFN